MPGGAQAMLQPWRNLYAQLKAADGSTQQRTLLTSGRLSTAKPLATVDRMIVQDVNSPLASSRTPCSLRSRSAGRLRRSSSL
ncbi:MAG: hypothetical protein U1E25_03265 [Methylocystis sp.]